MPFVKLLRESVDAEKPLKMIKVDASSQEAMTFCKDKGFSLQLKQHGMISDCEWGILCCKTIPELISTPNISLT